MSEYSIKFHKVSLLPASGTVGHVYFVTDNGIYLCTGETTFEKYSSTITVDASLSSSSTNPVQNSVIYEKITSLEDLVNQVAPTDLSMCDIYGNKQLTRNTANCYVVSSSGNYCFPLVYGNAIKNGLTNSAAYTGSGSGKAGFFNYLGNQITSPYIETDTGSTVYSAEIKIYDLTHSDYIRTDVQYLEETVLRTNPNNTVIKNVKTMSIGGVKYLNFYVSVDDATQSTSEDLDPLVDSDNYSYDCSADTEIKGCNAIISVRDASDNIMWSWNIWVVPYHSGFNTLSTYTATTSNNVSYTFLSRPLGSISEKVVQHGYVSYSNVYSRYYYHSGDYTSYYYAMPLYQYGRKDIIPYDSLFSDTYDSESDSWTSSQQTSYSIGSTVAGAVANTIKNPHTFFNNNTYTYKNGSDTFYNYWNASCNSAGAADNLSTALKTIYDPCPPGFMVPTGLAGDSLTDPISFTSGDNYYYTNLVSFGNGAIHIGKSPVFYHKNYDYSSSVSSALTSTEGYYFLWTSAISSTNYCVVITSAYSGGSMNKTPLYHILPIQEP